jgi:hypothetical protein
MIRCEDCNGRIFETETAFTLCTPAPNKDNLEHVRVGNRRSHRRLS